VPEDSDGATRVEDTCGELVFTVDGISSSGGRV
jgi:hypothetical protein